MRLLIVDDEAFVRKGLINNIHWNELGITSIEQADDGCSALKKVESFPPDVLITDIKMPRMDGIQLAQKIRDLFPYCQIVFLSAYSDKEYLKAAISLRATDYVEKPIDIQEIYRVVSRGIEECLERKRMMAGKQDTLMRYLISFLHGEALQASEIHFPDGFFWRVILIKIKDDGSVTAQNLTEISSQFTSLFSQQKFIIHNAQLEHDILVFLIGSQEENHLPILESLCHKLIKAVEWDIFISIGRSVTSAEQVKESFQGAEAQMRQLFYLGYNYTVFDEHKKEQLFDFLESALDSFSEYLEQGDNEQAARFVCELTKRIKPYKDTTVNYIKNIYLWLLLRLQDAAQFRGLDLSLNPKSTNMLENILRMETLEEIERYLLSLINIYFEKLTNSSVSYLVTMVESDIASHYKDFDLTLKSICERLYISPSYLCVVYKRETGRTIKQYMSNFRIEKAKQLIKCRKNKLQDVAASVGYADPNYFTKIFKKTTGLTPTEYRERLAK